MYTPTYIQLKYYYYPVGNTPAVNLLRDFPNESIDDNSVNILSLACGDPRNVLFTLWCDQNNDRSRTFSFTCCDFEPAILARNVVLYTLIGESAVGHDANPIDISTVWNLFYNFYIPKKHLKLLQTHVAKLILASESYDAWKISPYGSFIRLVDKGTLVHLRNYWSQYAEPEEAQSSRVRNRQAREAIAKRSSEIGDKGVMNGVRAAGPLWTEALEVAPELYRRYWKTGVAGGGKEDIKDLGKGGQGEVNPLFAISSAASQTFAVHYGTDPLASFHVAEAYWPRVGKKSTDQQIDRFAAVAKLQFRDWCQKFRDYIAYKRVIIRLCYSDALAFAHRLQSHIAGVEARLDAVPSFRKAWSSESFLLDGDCPVQPYHIIDTSNLGDHVGLINIISATRPLLCDGITSVMYTESLLMATEDISASLAILLGSDIATFALLVGLAPSGLQSNVTMEAVGNEAALFSFGNGGRDLRQYRMRLAWRQTVSGIDDSSQIAFDPDTLAAYMFSMYKKMFAHEDMTQLTARMERFTKGIYSVDTARYTRAAMIALIRIVRVHINTDWSTTLRLFLHHLETDYSLLVGSNSMQELCMYLHLFGIFTADALSEDPRQLHGAGIRDRKEDEDFLALPELPSVLYLVLVVPRKNLKAFTTRHIDQVGTPALHICISQRGGTVPYENVFYSYQCFFGNVSCNVNTFDVVSMEEDQEGWRGNQDLVVITPVPAFGLLMGPRKGIKVALKVHTSPENLGMYSSEFGFLLKIYETGLDKQRCFVSRNIPGQSLPEASSAQYDWTRTMSSRNQRPLRVLVHLDSKFKATQFQLRLDFPRNGAASQELSSGSNVAIEHKAPSVLTGRIGKNVRHGLVYPLSIQGSKAKTRIARKSSWIEVTVPIADPSTDALDSWTEMVYTPTATLTSLAIPTIDLSIQPRIPISKDTEATWIRTFLGPTVSDSEATLNAAEYHSSSSGNAKLDLKRTLNLFFSTFGGLNKRSPAAENGQVFQLCVEESCHTMIFTTALYHDLDLGSICLEAYVLALTIDRVMALGRALPALGDQATPPLGVAVTSEETVLWKRLLPSLAERCRTYAHKEDCEYRRPGATIPLSTADEQSPLCSCGEGQVSATELMKMGGGTRAWRPFAKYVTRIAISPIFPVPFVESSMSAVREKLREAPTQRGTDSLATGVSNVGLRAGRGCDQCGKEAGGGAGQTLKTCAACGKAKYCGAACQKAAWKVHKKTCGK